MAPPPQPAPPSPFAWGKSARVRELLGHHFDLRFEEGTNRFRYGSGRQAWELWSQHYGPTRALAQSLDEQRREELARDMMAWHETFPSGLGYEQPRDHLITHGVRTST